jgi:hypothetical protein
VCCVLSGKAHFKYAYIHCFLGNNSEVGLRSQVRVCVNTRAALTASMLSTVTSLMQVCRWDVTASRGGQGALIAGVVSELPLSYAAKNVSVFSASRGGGEF